MTDDDRVFKALADPTRRFLLDRLFERDGRTLTELESELEMTRFGVMKHLRLLEDAGLVVARRSGREKLHFLNPVPIRLIHDRWIDKYTERQVSALADLKSRTGAERMTSATQNATTTQVYRVYIKATPEAIWDAITKPEWTQRYGYGGIPEFDLRPGAALRRPPRRGDGAVPRRPGRHHRRRDPRGRPAAAALDDLADADGRADGRRGLHEADLRDRSDRDRRHAAHGHPRARGRADAGRDGRPARRRPRAPAAAGRGRCPTSSRCSRPASGSPTETFPAWREARSGGSPACYSSPPAAFSPSSRASPSPMRRARRRHRARSMATAVAAASRRSQRRGQTPDSRRPQPPARSPAGRRSAVIRRRADATPVERARERSHRPLHDRRGC